MKPMESRYQRSLFDRFPALFQGAPGESSEDSSPMTITCGDAWYPFLVVFCRTLTRMKAGMAITSIEERHAKLYIEGLISGPQHLEVLELVQQLRDYTERVCMNCGTTKTLDSINNGWVVPYCESCFQGRPEQRKNRNQHCLEQLNQMDFDEDLSQLKHLGDFQAVCETLYEVSSVHFYLTQCFH